MPSRVGVKNVHFQRIALCRAQENGGRRDRAGSQLAIKDARANFSTLVDKAISDGPQIVTRNGKKAAVVVSIEEWVRRERAAAGILSTSSPIRHFAKRGSRSSANATIRARSSFDGLPSRHECRFRTGAA